MTAAHGTACPGLSCSKTGAWQVMRHGLFRWTTDTGGVSSEDSVFPYHRASTTVVLYWAALASAVVEVPILHLVIRHWNHRLAWIATALGIVAILYVIALVKGMYLRPVVLTDGRLMVRLGIRRELGIPLGDIISIGPAGPAEPGVIRLYKVDTPNVRVVFSQGVEVGAVEFFLSEPGRLLAAYAGRSSQTVSPPSTGIGPQIGLPRVG